MVTEVRRKRYLWAVLIFALAILVPGLYVWSIHRLPAMNFDRLVSLSYPDAMVEIANHTNNGSAVINGRQAWCCATNLDPGRGGGDLDFYCVNIGKTPAFVWRSVDGRNYVYGHVLVQYYDWRTHSWKVAGKYRNQSFRCLIPDTQTSE